MAWIDPDGRHVWYSHDCADRVRSITKLPWPQWRADGDKITPSIDCADCGTHVFAPIHRPPAGWEAPRG